MGAIAAPNVSARTTMAQFLNDTALARAKTSAFSAKARNSDASAADPVDILDLSERAKAMLERNKTDQLVADRLDILFAIARIDDKSEARRSRYSAFEPGDGFSGQSASKQRARSLSRNALVFQYLSSLYRA